MAEEAGLDLVEVSPDAKPPVAKILDYGKFKYQEQKKANEARKKQKVIEIKEIKMRPMIDDHDYDVKMQAPSSASSRKATRSRSRCASAAARWRIRSSAGNCSTGSRATRSRSPRSNPSRVSKAARSSWCWRRNRRSVICKGRRGPLHRQDGAVFIWSPLDA